MQPLLALRQSSLLDFQTKTFFSKKDKKADEKSAQEPEKTDQQEAKTDSKLTVEGDAKKNETGSLSDGEAELTKEDVKKIKSLFAEQEQEIDQFKKTVDELKTILKKGEGEMTAFRIEYTKQVRENEDTVKRYRKMIEDEKQFAITKFAKDLLEVRDAVRFALENTDNDLIVKEKDIEALREKFLANLEGQVMTAQVMDRVLGRFNLEQYDPKGTKFDPKMHEAVFTVAESELENGFVAVTMQTGWKIGDRILRAAKVGIVKK